MALASDAMYRPRISAASYVSSSVYYGYVPPCTRDNSQQVSRVAECSELETAGRRQCYNGSAMETDEAECGYRLDSYRVISPDTPSTSRQYRSDFYSPEYQEQRAAIQDADRTQRMNRKRCSGDLTAGSQHKRFREGNAKDDGLASVRYESAPLRLNTIADKVPEHRPALVNGCCWPAGNRNSINDRDYKRSLSSNRVEAARSSLEYEKMLFETHGCSVYHHHRHQLSENGCIETEF